MNLSEVKDWTAITAGAIALATLAKSVIEYVKQGAQGRAKQFSELRVRFKSDPTFRNICDLLENDSPDLRKVPPGAKIDFLGFYEEIALLVNSRLMKKHVAHYMFAYYAIRCWESDNFWQNQMNRDSPYWALFRYFVSQMAEIEKAFQFNPKGYKL
jgi:hypothetical protein